MAARHQSFSKGGAYGRQTCPAKGTETRSRGSRGSVVLSSVHQESETRIVIMTSDGKYDEATGQVNYLNREYGASENAFDDIDRLTIADFIGYDGNGGEIYYTRYMEGFTDVLFSSIWE